MPTTDFIFDTPKSTDLQGLVQTYFYIDATLEGAMRFAEQVLPFPRITFGYFFDAPFSVKNLLTQETQTARIAIANIQQTVVEVTPTTDRIRILGAHLQPFALSSFTRLPIASLPWLIDPFSLFGQATADFVEKVESAHTSAEWFEIAETAFLNCLLAREVTLVTEGVKFIETREGICTVGEVAKACACSERTLWNHFLAHIGVPPKELIQLTKVKNSLYQMLKTDGSLTEIAHAQHFTDQAHFINTLRGFNTGKPLELRKKLPTFRFLQF
jgi:AraC-like DNA-binding protein